MSEKPINWEAGDYIAEGGFILTMILLSPIIVPVALLFGIAWGIGWLKVYFFGPVEPPGFVDSPDGGW